MAVIDRSDLVALLNSSGLTENIKRLRSAFINKALSTLTINSNSGLAALKEDPRAYDNFLLNSVGPAAATAAVEYAIRACRKAGKYKQLSFNGSVVNNMRLVQNDGVGDGYQPFSSVLRQYLLPRYAYLDFDRVVDPKHLIDEECGYPKFITPIMYRYMYDRDDVARRVVDIYPDESWAADPVVYEGEEKREPKTAFEKGVKDLCDSHNLLQYCYRIDRLAGVGHYGALLLGIDDGEDLEKPINEIGLLKGIRRTVSSKERGLLYMRPFDEYLSFIHQYETDVMHPRHGKPKFYNLVFLDMTIDAAGASIGTRLNRRVHWSRVVHVADNLNTSLVFGTPRQQPVFNRLLDLRKIKGSSAEMFWKGGFPGISFEIDPKFVADDPEFDKVEMREEIEAYASGQQKYLRLIGISAKSLAPNIPENPEKYVDVQVKAIAAHFGVPYGIFLGFEQSKAAQSQNSLMWNKRLNKRIRKFVEPEIIRNILDRFIAIGILPPPESGSYQIGWEDLNTPTDEDKANLALKYTQALSQYVATGIIHLIQPMDYLTMIMGLSPVQAKMIVDSIEKNGGWKKLKDVDPSQGAGQNGVRENNVSKGEKTGTKSSRPKKRDSATKKNEGISS